MGKRRKKVSTKTETTFTERPKEREASETPVQANRLPVPYLDEYALAEKFHTPEPGEVPYGLFLGAGASASSRIPTASGMVKHWQMKVFRSLIEYADDDPMRFQAWLDPDTVPNKKSEWVSDGTYAKWKNEVYGSTRNDDDYSLLFGRFYPTRRERQLLIERLFDRKRPGPGYLFLGGLIAADIVNCVLTTNFDELLHDMLMRFYDIRPIVCAFDSAVSGIRVRSKRPKIIKLHGDFLYDNIKNMKNELRALDTNMEEKMREVCKDSGLVVVGYSGRDESVMHPIRDMLRKPDYLNMGLHWCFTSERTVPNSVVELAENHEGKVTLYKIRSFDSLMERIFTRNGCQWPMAFRNPSRNNVLNDFCEAVTGGTSDPPSKFLSDILEDLLQKAMDGEDSVWTEIQLADIRHRQGSHARSAGDSQAAFERFQAAEQLLLGKDASVDIDPTAYVRIARRRCGLQIAFAKLVHDKQPSAAIKHLRTSLQIIDRGIEWIAASGATNLNSTYVRTLPFNGCCALGLLHLWGSINAADVRQQVSDYIRLIIKLDPSRAHLRKLCDDRYDPQGDGCDFRLSLLPELMDDLEAEFGKLH
jgi:SIR2-like domain